MIISTAGDACDKYHLSAWHTYTRTHVHNYTGTSKFKYKYKYTKYNTYTHYIVPCTLYIVHQQNTSYMIYRTMVLGCVKL